MTRIRWTTKAVEQLEAVVDQIREDHPEAASAVAQGIFDYLSRLETFPRSGRPGEKEGTRELVYPPYIIVYRLHSDVAEVLYIWHGAQDWR